MKPEAEVVVAATTDGEIVAIEQCTDQVRHAFGEDWASRPSGLRLRDECDVDAPFLKSLYASTRAAELDRVDWPQETKDAFIAHQFDAQRRQYRQHYAGAAFMVIEQAGETIGRLYLHHARAELRLMDVSLLPSLRGQGVGTALMQRLMDWGDALHLPVTLHVEPFNPAQRLYLRLGFETLEVRGVYHFMQRLPTASA